MVHSSAATTLGHPTCKHQNRSDENDDEIQRLLEEKHRLYKHFKMILAQYPRKQSTAAFVRQSRPSLETCEIVVSFVFL